MGQRFRTWLGGMGLALAMAATAAHAAPVTLPLNYVLHNGTPGYTLAGSITYDDAIEGSNVSVGGTNDLTGLLAFNLTLSGPDVPGGTTSFALSDINGWRFATDAGGRIIDINFFGGTNATTNCTLDGVDPFILHFDCNVGAAIANMRLVYHAPGIPVPSLDPAALALLALLVAAFAAAAARRRLR
jgi:hypothetical protein